MADDDYTPIITDEIRSWIGKEGPTETAEVTLREIQRFGNAVTLGEPDPLFFDEAAAAESPWGGLTAPFLFYGIPFGGMADTSVLGEDGIPRSGTGDGLRPPIPLPRIMAGGTKVEYFRPLRPGDVLTRQSRISDIAERRGSSGPLVFTSTETTYRDQADETVLLVTTTTISR